MRLLVDANLSPVVAEVLRERGFDARHVVDHGLVTASDEKIATFAVEHSLAVVSLRRGHVRVRMLPLGGRR